MTTLGRRLAALLVLGMSMVVVLASPAQAAEDVSIDHAEHSAGQLKLLVSVPGGDAPDLDSVTVTFDGAEVESTAETAARTD